MNPLPKLADVDVTALIGKSSTEAVEIDRPAMLIRALQEKKTVPEFLEHFANQYYIYGKDRSHLLCWAPQVRSAVERDALHFTQCDSDIEYARFMERRGREQFHFTRRVVANMFKDVSEYSAYVVEEEEDMSAVLNVLKDIYYRGKRNEFKIKLNGNGNIHNW